MREGAVKPIFKAECWICPTCGKENPYPNTIILTYPPIVCYKCRCGFHYDERSRLSPEEEYRLRRALVHR